MGCVSHGWLGRLSCCRCLGCGSGAPAHPPPDADFMQRLKQKAAAKGGSGTPVDVQAADLQLEHLDLGAAENVLNLIMGMALPYARLALGKMIHMVSEMEGEEAGLPLGRSKWLRDEQYLRKPAARLIILKKDEDGDGHSDIDPRTAIKEIDVDLVDTKLLSTKSSKHLVARASDTYDEHDGPHMIYAEFTSIMTLELHEDVDFKLVIDPSNALMQISKETKSRFLSWISRKSAQAVKWATPSLNLELNRFRMECSIEVGFNMDCLTFKFTKPAKVDWDIEFGVSPFGRVDFEFPDWFEDSMIPKAIEFAIASLVGVRFRIPMRYMNKMLKEEEPTEADGKPEHEPLPSSARVALPALRRSTSV